MSEMSKGLMEGKTLGAAIGGIDDYRDILETYLKKETSILKLATSENMPIEIEVKTKVLKNYLLVLLDALEEI